MRAPQELVIRGQWECDGTASAAPPYWTTLFDTGEEGSKDNVSLEFTIGPVFRVPVRLSCDKRLTRGQLE